MVSELCMLVFFVFYYSLETEKMLGRLFWIWMIQMEKVLRGGNAWKVILDTRGTDGEGAEGSSLGTNAGF
jgi:hypothetical protein